MGATKKREERVWIEPIEAEDQMTAEECIEFYQNSRNKDYALQYLCESNGVDVGDMKKIVSGSMEMPLPKEQIVICPVATLNEYGKSDTKPLTDEREQRARRLYLSGYSIKEVVKLTGMSRYLTEKACAGITRARGSYDRSRRKA